MRKMFSAYLILDLQSNIQMMFSVGFEKIIFLPEPLATAKSESSPGLLKT